MRGLLISFILLNFAICNIAKGSGLSLEGLEAYKLNLEHHLDAKVRQAVKPIVDETLFTLSVNVVMKPTEEISRLLNASLNANTEIIGPEPVAEDFQFVTEKPNEEETLLPLTKLGMWEKKTKPLKPKEQLPPAKTLTFMSYRDFISNIDLSFYTDMSVTAEINKSIEQVVKNAAASYEPKVNAQFFQLSIVKPKVEDKVKPEATPKPEDPAKKDPNSVDKKNEEKKLSLMELLIEFKIPITLFFCSLMLFALGIYIMSKLNSISERKIDLLEKQSQREDAAFKANEIRDFEDHKSTAEKTSPIDEKSFTENKNHLIEKLNSYIEVSAKPLCQMISKWIKFKNAGYEESLNFIARAVPVDKLNKVTELLSDEDRAHWNQVLSSGFNIAMEPIAVDFIESQLLMNVLQPEPKLDDQVREIINEISFAEILKVLQSFPEIGAILITFLNTSQIAKIFEALDGTTVGRISQAGMLLTQKIIDEKIQELHITLVRIKSETHKLSPFGEKVQAILKDVQIEKEESLFKALAMQMEKNQLIEIARTQFPAEIITELPKDLLKRAFTTFPLTTRAEFILSQKPDRQAFLLQLVGEGRNKEIIEEEIDNLQTDQLKVISIQRSSEKYWKQFVQVIRTMIQKDESVQAELFPILSNWADKISVTNGGDNGIRAA